MPTPLVWNAFQLNSICYFYMYRGPVFMDNKTRKLQKCLSLYKNFPWIVSVLGVVIGIGFTCVVYAILREIFYPRGNVTTFNFALYLGVFTANILSLSINFIPLLSSTYVESFNALIKFEEDLKNEFPDIARQIEPSGHLGNSHDLVGLALNGMVALLASSPLAMTLIGVLMDLDQVHYVFEDFLPPPTERERLEHIVIPLLFRLIICGIGIFEALRAITFGALITATYVTSTETVIKIISKIPNYNHSLRKYRQLQIVAEGNYITISWIGLVLATLGVFGTVVVMWMTIMTYNIAPSIYAYMLCPLMAVAVVSFTFIIVPPCIFTYETSMAMIELWKVGIGSRNMIDQQMQLRKIGKREAMAFKPIYVHIIGPFFVAKRGFEMDYLDVILKRLTDALLLS